MSVPKFDVEDIEDAYAYYVLILGIPEDYFWHADVASVKSVALDKSAYDAWEASEQRKQAERARKEASRKSRR